MDEGISRPRKADKNRRHRAAAALESRPDRVALWAVFLCLFTMIVAAATAQGSSTGGAAIPGNGNGGAGPAAIHLGSRVLHLGMEGDDVRVLNGIVASKPYADRVTLTKMFRAPTAGAVRQFQRRNELPVTGAVNRSTARQLTASMGRVRATWYGPGFYGNHTACGQILRLDTIGVAHRSLPCGTKVTFAYHGRYLVVPVIDTGPYNGVYEFDLTRGAGKRLGFDYSDTIRYAISG